MITESFLLRVLLLIRNPTRNMDTGQSLSIKNRTKCWALISLVCLENIHLFLFLVEAVDSTNWSARVSASTYN